MTTPTDTTITSTVSHDLAWLKGHLILLAIVGVLIIGGVYGVETMLANRSHEQFLQQQTILKQFTEQNAQVQQQMKTSIDAFAAQNAALQAQMVTLTTAIVARDGQLMKDRQTVKTLPPAELSAKWGTVAVEPAPAIDPSGNFLVPLPLAQKSVDALIQVPVLTEDKKDLQTQLASETTIATNNDGKYKDEQKAHQSDNEACKQTVATKDAEIKDIKAQGRKREMIIMIVSAIFGFAARR